MEKPMLIIIDGPNGAGKTTLAKCLHPKLRRTALLQWDVLKKLISDFKPGDHDHDITGQLMRGMAQTYLKNDISLLCEAYWGSPENMASFIEALGLPSARIFIYQLEAPHEVRVERAEAGWQSGQRNRLLSADHIKRNDAKYEQVRFPEARILDSHKHSVEQLADQILKDIAEGA